MAPFTLSREERLSSIKEIELLFAEGHSLSKYPIRLIWKSGSDQDRFPVQVLFSVSKKRFPKAVDRNRIKRLLRENYRLYKPDLYKSLSEGRSIHLAVMFTGNEMPDFKAIRTSLNHTLERLATQVRSR